MLGNTINIIENTKKTAGKYTIDINTKDIPAGIYFYNISNSKQKISNKLIISH
jgi:hypothetical protein